MLPLGEEDERLVEGLEMEELEAGKLEIREEKLQVGELGLTYRVTMSVLETRRGFLGKKVL